MKQWTLACAVLTVAGLAASEAPAQETLQTQPTQVIRSESAPRTAPGGRRMLGRRDVAAPSVEIAPRTETTIRVEPAPMQYQPSTFESRREGPFARLRSRLGRS